MITDVYFVGNDGKKRNGKQATCKHCRTVFVTRPSWDQKFCSEICARLAKRKRVSVTCASCSTVFEKTPSKANSAKSGLHFCSRLCKDRAQRIGGRKEIQPPHYGTGKAQYREIFLAAGGVLACARCGYNEFPSSVEIHHKDFNHNNNVLANLLPLCANCHSGLHKNCWSL